LEFHLSSPEETQVKELHDDAIKVIINKIHQSQKHNKKNFNPTINSPPPYKTSSPKTP